MVVSEDFYVDDVLLLVGERREERSWWDFVPEEKRVCWEWVFGGRRLGVGLVDEKVKRDLEGGETHFTSPTDKKELSDLLTTHQRTHIFEFFVIRGLGRDTLKSLVCSPSTTWMAGKVGNISPTSLERIRQLFVRRTLERAQANESTFY